MTFSIYFFNYLVYFLLLQKFNLEESSIAVEVNYIIALDNLKKKLKDLQNKTLLNKFQNITTFGVRFFYILELLDLLSCGIVL